MGGEGNDNGDMASCVNDAEYAMSKNFVLYLFGPLL